MYTLKDTFNDRHVSRHRTLEAAVRAMARHGRAVKRAHGPAAYLPMDILDADGQPIHVEHPEYGRLIYLEAAGR